MLVVLPLIFSTMVLRVFLDRGFALREAILRTAVIAGAVTAISTEALSAFSELTRAGVAMAWSLAAIGAALYWYASPRRKLQPGNLNWRRIWQTTHLVLLVPALALVGVVAANALFLPNHINDVLIYHLPRVQFWLQNHTVAFFPSAFAPQLFMPPWAEYAGAHYVALTGSERGLGLIQTLSMALCAVAASGIVELLGFSAIPQLLAGVFALTVPQGAMEAYDFDNDYVCAFWTAVVAYFLVSFLLSRRTGDAMFAGAAIGIALLTKGTAYLYVAPFVALTAVTIIRRPKQLRAGVATAVILPVLLLNGAHWIRNYRTFNSPLGCAGPHCHWPFQNDAISRRPHLKELARTAVENVVRNIGMHLGTSNPALNRKIEAGLTRIIYAAGGSPNDPHTTWRGAKFTISEPPAKPDEIGNPWHLIVIGSAFTLLSIKPNGNPRLLVPYAACVLAAAFLFCVFLRWNQYVQRLQLPLFVLSAPMVAGAFAIRPRGTRVLAVICFLLFAPALIDTWFYQLRAPVPIEDRGTVHLLPTGSSAALKIRELTNCRRVGFDSEGVLVREGSLLSILGVSTGQTYVQHINLGGPDDLSQYCAIVCIRCDTKPAREKLYFHAGFVPDFEDDREASMLLVRPMPIKDDLRQIGSHRKGDAPTRR